MTPGRYFYAMFLMFLILLGGAVLAVMTMDVAVAIIWDNEATIGAGWSPIFMALGLASLITTYIDTIRRD
jgi:steroid 5-alpha reductase family enzyme